MKKAVLLSNHFRSFNYIKSYVKSFFGEETTYFISTWDYNYGYSNSDDVKNYETKTHNYIKYSTSPLSRGYIEDSIKDLGRFKLNFHTNDEFFDWANNFYESKFLSSEEILFKYGQLFSCINSYQQLIDSQEKFDVVFRLRLDCIPYFSKEKSTSIYSSTISKNSAAFNKNYSLEEDINILVKKEKSILDNKRKYQPILMSGSPVRITQGWPWIDDQFFYGKEDAFEKLYSNCIERINSLVSTKVFANDELRPYWHDVFGLLLLGQNIKTVKSNIQTVVIRKDHVDKKVDLTDLSRVFKIKSDYHIARHSNKFLYPYASSNIKQPF